VASSWNHNSHFYPLARRALLPGTRALDLGCGEGLLSRELRNAGAVHVLGVDLSPAMVQSARERAGGDAGLEYHVADFLTMPVTERFGLLTCFATLHHVDLEAGLERLKAFTAPGGRLVVVGLARTSGPVDLALSLASFLLDPLVKARRGYWDHPAPLADPEHSYAEVRAVAARLLPGARFRRRLFYRFSLEWTAPAEGTALSDV